MKESRGFDPNTIHAPILHFYEDIESFMIPDFDLMNSLKNSDRFLVKVERLNHAQFTSFGMAGGTIPGISDKAGETKLKCEAMYNVILFFMDTFVKERENDSENQVAQTVATMLPEDLVHLVRIGPSKK